MDNTGNVNYQRVAAAITYIRQHFKTQPDLEEIASEVHLSAFHFQRLFKDWAGVSPKKFLQYLSVEHAKTMLLHQQATLFDAAAETGLSGTGRLHDLFVKIEGMTPGEFKNGGEQLLVQYSFAESPFGNILVAATTRGVCHIAFIEEEKDALDDLKKRFPRAGFKQAMDVFQQDALTVFSQDMTHLPQVKLHLKGTGFQLKVWEALLKIPMGRLCTYGDLAREIQHPKASRAVGTAIGSNPVAYLIPCHRVIQSSGAIGGYMWGPSRKTAIIGWESARTAGGLF